MINLVRFRILCIGLACVTVGFVPRAGLAQEADAKDRAGLPVTVGIDGHYRIGCWTAVKLNSPSVVTGSSTAAGGELGVETLDGDGVRVVYRQSDGFTRGESGYAVPGSEAAPLVIRRGAAAVISTRFPYVDVPAKGPSMIPRSMPWVVVIGDPLGIDRIGANELLNRPASVAVTIPKSSDAFPDQAIGYEGVDAILVTGSGSPLLGQLKPAQQVAMQQWLLGGGRMILTLGESAPQLINDAPWLRDLLPDKFGEIKTTMIDPSAIEAYTSTQVRLDPFMGVDLPRELGQVLVLGRTTRKVSTPVVVDYVVGLGRITVIAADLDSKMFAEWPQRLDMVTRLTGDLLTPSSGEPGQQSRATSFSDLAGQLKSTLDQFSMKGASFGSRSFH